LWVEANFREGILPPWDSKVHNHEPEIVCKTVCDEIPLAAEILEPDLRLVGIASEHESKSAILYFRINFKCADVLPD
jgi:hypothetical protein